MANNVDEELRQSSEMLSTIFDLNPDAIVLTRVVDGKIVDCNHEYLNQIGYSREEVIGHTTLELNLYSPKVRQAYLDKLHERDTVTNFELKVKRKDNIFIYVLYSARFITINNENILLNIGKDITKRKQNENTIQEHLENEQQLTEELQTSNEELQSTIEELRVSNEELQSTTEELQVSNEAGNKFELASKYNRSLIEASLDPLVTIGSDGKITDVNRSTENVTGFTRDELIGTDFSNYFTNAKMARKGYQQVFKEGFVLDYPLEIKHKNGHITPVLYNASVYKDDLGKVLGVFAAARDITEIQKAEDILVNYHDNLEERVKIRTKELAESNEDLKRFAYITSHDLREPLRMITNFLQLLERRYKDKLDQDAIDFINFAVDGAKRLDDMINDLLEYSRLTRIDLHFTQVNSEKALEETLIILKVLIEENNAVVTYDPLPNIIGDEILFIQLFQNLINNAIKYRSQETPQIHISAKKENNQYLFSVKDNGIGIDSKHLDRIFTIFQRLHGKDEYEGTGIGLAIAEYIVHKFGGVIWVESELGKGSTFYFTIPIKS